MPRITAFEKQRDRGNLRALFSVKIGHVVVHDFRLVQQPGQRAFVQPPIRTWVNKEGKICYAGPLVELPPETLQAVRKAVMDSGEEW